MAFNLVTFPLRFTSHLLKKSLMENLHFYAVQGRGVVRTNDRINRKEKNHF